MTKREPNTVKASLNESNNRSLNFHLTNKQTKKTEIKITKYSKFRVPNLSLLRPPINSNQQCRSCRRIPSKQKQRPFTNRAGQDKSTRILFFSIFYVLMISQIPISLLSSMPPPDFGKALFNMKLI